MKDILRKEDLESLGRWFYAALNHNRKMPCSTPRPFGAYYEFGVGWGSTLTRFIRAREIFCKDFDLRSEELKIFCFDSFKGLPESELDADRHPMWRKGQFAHGVEEIRSKISSEFGDSRVNAEFIEGFFVDSLTEDLRDRLTQFPPAIVTVDVDYYSSTKIVLEWLRPFMMSGTLFYFDDIWAYHGHPEFGQVKAISEFNEAQDGLLVPFGLYGMNGNTYVYSRRDYEYIRPVLESPVTVTNQ